MKWLRRWVVVDYFAGHRIVNGYYPFKWMAYLHLPGILTVERNEE